MLQILIRCFPIDARSRLVHVPFARESGLGVVASHRVENGCETRFACRACDVRQNVCPIFRASRQCETPACILAHCKWSEGDTFELASEILSLHVDSSEFAYYLIAEVLG